MSHKTRSQRLSELLPPERNHYFYGKLLDERNLQMEQDYFNRKRWLLNRLGLGTGVLCGLVVSLSPDQRLVCLMPGVAVDELGREIIVPQSWCFDPWQITDGCGQAAGPLAKDKPHTIAICLAYNECFTDYAPVLATDCNAGEQCAPGTVRESFCVRVTELEAPPKPAEVDPKLCEALNAPAAATSERRRQVCGVTLGACATPSETPCVPIATVTLNPDGTIDKDIDNCGARTMVYSNAMLLDMILCLAERVEECCDKTPKAHLTLTKTANVPSYAQVGDVITFTVTATNDGDTPLTNVSLTDAGLTLTCTPPGATLAPGAALTCTGTHTVTQADLDAGAVTNMATAAGTDPSGKVVTTPPVTVTVPAVQRPHLTLKKAPVPPTPYAAAGVTLHYEMTAINDGNVTLTDLSFSDPALGALSFQPHQPLKPGQSLTATGSYSVTQADLARGFFKNVATATGLDPRGQPVSATADVTVKANVPPPDDFRIAAVELMGSLPGGGAMTSIAKLDPQQMRVRPDPISKQKDGRILAIDITFSQDCDPQSVTVANWGQPNPKADFSVYIQSPHSTRPDKAIVGQMHLLTPRRARFLPHDNTPLTEIDRYTMTVYGDAANRGGAHPFVLDTYGTQLDGEPTQLPSGNGVPGGNFQFEFQVSN